MVFLGSLRAYANLTRQWTHQREPWMAYAAVRASVRWRVAGAEIGRLQHTPTGTITAMKACGARRNEVVMCLHNKYGSWGVSHTHLRHHGVPQRGAVSRMRTDPKGALRAVFLAVSDQTLNGHQRPPWRRIMAFLGSLMAYANRAR